MTLLRSYIVVLVLTGISLSAQAGTDSSAANGPRKGTMYYTIKQQGDRLYKQGDYRHAVLHYKRYYKRYPGEELLSLMSECYWQMGYYDSAMSYMVKLQNGGVLVQERMAEIEARRGNYDGAIQQYGTLLSKAGGAASDKKPTYDARVAGFNKVSNMYRDSMDWNLSYLSLNSSAHETAPYVYKGRLYVVSNRLNSEVFPIYKTMRPGQFHYVQQGGSVKDLTTRPISYSDEQSFDYSLTHLPDLTVRTSNDSRTFLPRLRKRKLPFHGGSMTRLFEFGDLREVVGNVHISEDGSTLYYSRIKSKKDGGDGVQQLEICSSRNRNGQWGRGEALNLNAVGSSSFHPFVYNGGRSMLFVSDRQGGQGGLDIYQSDLQSDGRWSEPLNVSWVNTSSDEFYPVVFGEELYFSSTGWSGLGGSDIFQTSLNKTQDEPRNLGYPINSSRDDYGISFSGKDKGYFATNRYGSDDVLGFDFRKKYVVVGGSVIDGKSGLRVAGVEVLLEEEQPDGSWLAVDSFVTDYKGIYKLHVRPNRSNYRLTYRSKKHVMVKKQLDTYGISVSREEENVLLERNAEESAEPLGQASSAVEANNNETTAVRAGSSVGLSGQVLLHIFDKKEIDEQSKIILNMV